MVNVTERQSNKRSYRLQAKVFIGLGLFLLGSSSIFVYLGIVSEVNRANLELLSQVRQLEVQGEFIQRRGDTYAAHAPRDYGSYNRDVIIFYPNFMLDLKAFDTQVRSVSKVASSLPSLPIKQSDGAVIDSIEELKSKWSSFKQGFQEKLGPNVSEPRLEWGADYVKENHALINAITGVLITTIDSAIEKQIEVNMNLTNVVVSGAGGLLLLGFIWFYFSVIRRITNMVIACGRVAQGDFGYQLPTKKNDELGALARAFNTLSSRTHLVVTMLTNMTRQGSVDSKVDTLWDESSSYLPMQWLGLFEVDEVSNILKLTSMRTERNLSESLKTTLVKSVTEDRYMLGLCKAGKVLKIDNLSEAAMQLPDAMLIRQLLKIGFLNSALCVPLISDKNWKGMIVLVDEDIDVYTDEHVELMGNLAPFITDGFTNTGITNEYDSVISLDPYEKEVVTLKP